MSHLPCLQFVGFRDVVAGVIELCWGADASKSKQARRRPFSASSSSHSKCRNFRIGSCGGVFTECHRGLVIFCFVFGGGWFQLSATIFSCVLLNRTSVNENILNCCSSHAFGWMCVFVLFVIISRSRVGCRSGGCEEDTQRQVKLILFLMTNEHILVHIGQGIGKGAAVFNVFAMWCFLPGGSVFMENMDLPAI